MSRSLGRALVRAGSIALAASVVLLATQSSSFAQGWHEDQRFGFKLLPPKGWKPIPLKASENWLVAKYLCDEKDRWIYGDGRWTWTHQPELMVIAFVKAADEEEKTEPDKPEEGKASEEDEEDEERQRYENYEDYLDRTYEGGGFYVASREDGVSNELPVTKLEIKVEKLAYTGPKRIVTWVFHAPDVDLAVQTEVLEDAYPKHKSTILSALRSFKPIPRTMGPLSGNASAGEDAFISLSDMKEGSPEERKQKRLESELQLHALAKKSMPAGWQLKEHKRFLLLYNTDAGFVDKVATNAEALFAWAEENLGFIGRDEYVRRPILRICDSREEKDSLQRGAQSSSSWWYSSGNEVVTCKDEFGATGWQMDQMNRELFHLWLRDRDSEIALGLPEWVSHGLYEYISGARWAGRKLEFKDYFYEMQGFREAAQKGQNIPVRELVKMPRSDFYGESANWSGIWNRMTQADMVVRFLLSPDAARNKQTKSVLFDYLAHLRDVLLEFEGQDDKKSAEDKKAGASKEPATEEEEEELYKKKRKAFEEREKAVLERTFERTFAGWSQKDWEAFEKAFLKFAN